MAKQVDSCMFCNEVPCVCNGPVVKKSAPKKRAPKARAVPDDTDSPPSVAPAKRVAKERAPLQAPRARGTKELKREKRSGAVSVEAELDRNKSRHRATPNDGPVPDEELERAVRVLDFNGLLHHSERAKYRRFLKRPAPTGQLIRQEQWEGGEANEDQGL